MLAFTWSHPKNNESKLSSKALPRNSVSAFTSGAPLPGSWTALRLVGGDVHLAEDVAQAVFTDLARKAGSLRGHATLSGWLHTSARFSAANVVRAEQRRRQREQTALTMPSNSTASSEPDWDLVSMSLK